MDKKKVIIFGVYGLREYFERKVSDNYEIIGFTDADVIPDVTYEELTTWDYRPFYAMNDLKKLDFDYIVITYMDEEAVKTIKQFLTDVLLIMDVKIIELYYFMETDFRNPIKEFENLNMRFEGIMLGLSHAYHGFLSHRFNKHIFKFAARSSDFYYQYKVLQYLDRCDAAVKKEMKYVIVDIPYFFFSWDISRAGMDMIYKWFNMLDIFDDYHNLMKRPEGYVWMRKCKAFKDMMNQYTKTDMTGNNFETLNQQECTPEQLEDIRNTIEKVWTDERKETIDENIIVYQNMMELIKKMNPDMSVALIIYPFNPIYVNAHREKIERKKAEFYKLIVENSPEDMDIHIFDYFDHYTYVDGGEAKFHDHCHMNDRACIEFSNILNKDLDKDFFD